VGASVGREAVAVKGYPQFRGVPVAQIADAIAERRDWAEDWVDKHFDAVSAAYAKGNPV
jgi:hypothetical protein